MDRKLKLLALSALLSATSVADTTFYDAVKWDFGSSLTVNSGITATFSPGSTVNATGATLVGFPGGTGASSFLGLPDTPDTYVGQGGKFVAVKTDVSGLEFVTAPTGGGGGLTSFTAGNLAPLFTTSVSSPTIAPVLSFTASSAGANMFFGNETGATATPHYVRPSFANLSGDFVLSQTPSAAAGSLIGRTSTGPGDWQEIVVGSGLLMTGPTLSVGTTVGNVLRVATPTADQLPIWTDATHIKGVTALSGGTAGQVLKKGSSSDYDWVWAPDISGTGGSSTFISLTDVPPTYAGAGGKLVAVNASASGLEFVVPAAGGGGVSSVFGRTGAVTAVSGDYSTFYQPVDADLTAIAALATTTFGQGMLTQTDAAASRSYIGAGTSSFNGTWTSLTGKPTTLSGFGITDAQPLDGDLTSLASATGTNSLYYRSATSTWAIVTIGGNMTFGSGILNAANPNWDTAYSERRQWDGGATGLVAANGRTSLGLVIGANVQAWSADLDSLNSASGTNTIYYRSAANTWSPVTMGSNMTFTGGTLNAGAASDSVKVVMLTSTAGGSYATPATVRALYVEGVGGGGGGGSLKITVTARSGAGGGGGGGGYAAVYIATPQATYSWDVGLGGTAGVTGGGFGGNGGPTTFGTVLTAGGGTGGVGGVTAGYTDGGPSAVGGAGGVGTVGGSLSTASDGTTGMALSATGAVGGQGGSSRFGGATQGGIAQASTQQPGNAGANYGGGGSGNAVISTVGQVGGAGAPGVIRVWEIY